MLLTRFKIRRLRFAMTTVSHTDGNRATSQARGETGALARPNRARVGRAASPVQPPTNRTFSLFKRHCADSAPVPVFPHAPEFLIDVRPVLHSVERMRSRSETACHLLWQMDFRQVAQCNRTEAARFESSSVVC